MIRYIKKLFSFGRAHDGTAFVEFALWAPLLVGLFLGGVEMTRYILVVQKAEKAAFIVADSVAQGQTVTNTDLSNIITAALQVMRPFTFGTSGYVIISSVTQTGVYSAGNPPKVSWQYTSNGTNGSWSQASHIGSPGLTATLPGNLTLNNKDNVIVAEIFYNFTPIIGTNGVIGNTMVYSVELYKPRLGALSSISPG